MNYYVYLHRKASDNEVFYVGKGKGRRAWNTWGRNSHWNHIVAKHGFFVELVEVDIQEWYAFELETELIDYYGREDNGYGILVNKVAGGSGVGYYPGTAKEEERVKQSKKMSGPGNPKADNTIYNFENVHTLEKFTGTRYGLEQKIGKQINDLFNTKSYSINGWTVEGKKGCNSTHDLNHYYFKHKSGDFFIGTRFSFKEKYGHHLKPLFSKTVNRRDNCKGWRLVRVVYIRKYLF